MSRGTSGSSWWHRPRGVVRSRVSGVTPPRTEPGSGHGDPDRLVVVGRVSVPPDVVPDGETRDHETPAFDRLDADHRRQCLSPAEMPAPEGCSWKPPGGNPLTAPTPPLPGPIAR